MFTKDQSPADLFDKLAYWMLLAVAALLPIAVYGVVQVPTVMTKILVAALLVLLSVIFYAFASMRRQEVSVPRSLLLGATWLLPAGYLLSTLFATDSTTSIYGKQLSMDSAAFFILGALALTLTAVIISNLKRALGLYLAMLGSAAVLTLLELIIFFARDAVAWTGIVLPSLSLIGTLNDLAVFFGLIILFTLLSLIILPVSNVVRGVLWGVLAASAFFMGVVNLTTVWWIVGIFTLAFFVYTLSTRFFTQGGSKAMTSLAPLAVLLVCAAYLFGSEAFTSALATKVNVGELDVRPSWQTTIGLGREALDGNAFFGAGPDSFAKVWSLHMPAEISQTVFWQVDFAYGIGLIPTAVIATGLLGLITWLIFFGVFGYMGFRSFFAARKVDRGDIVHYLRITSFVAALYLWIIALIQVPSPVLVIYAFILTGMFIASYTFGDDAVRSIRIVFEENPRAGFLVTLGLTFVVLASIGGMYSTSMRFAAESSYQKAVRVINTSGDLAEAEAYTQAAIARHPVDTYYRLLSNIDLVYVDQLLQTGEAPELIREQFQELLARAVSNAQRATILDARGYQNWSNFGSIYQSIVPLGIEGAAESASDAFDRALELRPNSASLYLSKATLERARGNAAEARTYVEKAVTLRNQYTNAIFLLAQMQLEEENTEDAIRSVEAITLFEPQNPVAHFQLGLLKYGTDDFTGAVQSLEIAVALNPEYANARYFLGLSYWRLGSLELSRRQFEEVLKTNPGNTEVQSIIQNLSEGRGPFETAVAADADIATREGLPLEGSANAQDDAGLRAVETGATSTEPVLGAERSLSQ